MLEELSIRGIGGIKSASLAFGGEFIVITGESGAGKSSLVRALEFISGRRAQANHIRSADDSCEAEAVLTSAPVEGLEERYQPQENSLIARRTFARSGKGRCTLQGQNAPLTVLIKAMERNIVIQSQFAQLSLLEPARQLELVDSCGGAQTSALLAKLDETFTAALAAEKQIVALKHLSGTPLSDAEKALLVEGGASGFSTFMSYFLLTALKENADMRAALSA